ncbi:MAG: hypothetical protein PHS41_12850, partial [Victivallaceae bacterium]|nr:hypothetical protein [Victivallaceae bacterium]
FYVDGMVGSVMKKNFSAGRGFEAIDAHIHPLLKKEGEKEREFASPASPDEFVEELKILGIRKVCGSVILRRNCRMKDVCEANRIALRLTE